MKLLFILPLLFCSMNSYSQNLESIKKNDTIYIYFNHSMYEKYGQKEKTDIKNEFLRNNITYAFSLNDYNTIYFFYRQYKDFDYFDKKIKTDVKTVRKKFLIKNKEKILDIDFFIKNGFIETFNAIYVPHKVIYLIDSREIKGRKITLKQVLMSAPNFTPE